MSALSLGDQSEPYGVGSGVSPASGSIFPSRIGSSVFQSSVTIFGGAAGCTRYEICRSLGWGQCCIACRAPAPIPMTTSIGLSFNILSNNSFL